MDEEINEVHTTSWEKLDRQVQKAHSQLQKKRSYKNAREKVRVMEKESYEKLPSYRPSSSMEMETLMKRAEVTLKDTENANKWKTKIINMLETKFASIILKSSTDVGHTNLHTVDLQVSDGNPVFIKQYIIPLKYQGFIDEETKWLEEAGLISRSLSNWSAPCMVVPKRQDMDKPNEVQLRMVIDYRQLNKSILTSRAPDWNGKIGKVISNYPIPTISHY